jgi:hypothetical protein
VPSVVQSASRVLASKTVSVNYALPGPSLLVAAERHANPARTEHDPAQAHQTLCSAHASLAMALVNLLKCCLVHACAANVLVASGALEDSTLCAKLALGRLHMTSVRLQALMGATSVSQVGTTCDTCTGAWSKPRFCLLRLCMFQPSL